MNIEQSDQFPDLNSFSNRNEHTGDFRKYGISLRKPQSKRKATGKDSREYRYVMALMSSIKTICKFSLVLIVIILFNLSKVHKWQSGVMNLHYCYLFNQNDCLVRFQSDDFRFLTSGL